MTKKESNARYRETHRAKLAEYKKENRTVLRDYNREYQRKWRNIPENRAKIRKEALAAYYKNRQRNIDRAHWYQVKRHYGLTEDQYNRIVELQGGGCALCGIVRQPNEKRHSIDHCHRSTIVRGVLCEACNVLLGRIEAKPGWVAKMEAYLHDPPAGRVVSTTCDRIQKSGLNRGINWAT